MPSISRGALWLVRVETSYSIWDPHIPRCGILGPFKNFRCKLALHSPVKSFISRTEMDDSASASDEQKEAANGLSEFLEIDGVELNPVRETKFQQTIYGSAIDIDFAGYDVNGYTAISRGVSRTIPTQTLATLLFRSSKQIIIPILTEVPQRVMCNCLFVVDLKKLPAETDIYFDGLGTWDQNCGKVTNYFKFSNAEAQDARGEKNGVVAFIRRTDRNLNCKAYNRVVVTSKDLGLAAVQYFFKGLEEQEFEISAYAAQKSVRASTLDSGHITRRSGKRKNNDDDPGESLEVLTIPSTSKRMSLRTAPMAAIPSHQVIATVTTVDGRDITASTLLSYLKTHINSERQERAEERNLRKEELEMRKRQRLEDRQFQKEEAEARRRDKLEEMDLRKQELNLERARLTLDQQRWEIDRKEKEIFLELLRKKLLAAE